MVMETWMTEGVVWTLGDLKTKAELRGAFQGFSDIIFVPFKSQSLT